MPARKDSVEFAERVNAPAYAKARDAALDYMSRADMESAELAERIGYGQSSVKHWLAGSYMGVGGNDKYIRAAIWDFIERHPLVPRTTARGRLFETENYRHIHHYFGRATEHGEISLLYGPPGTQKSFVLEHLICAQHRAKKESAIYVYASTRMSPMALLKRIGREMGVRISSQIIERVLNNILAKLGECEPVPAIVVDEAQHLEVASLEILRELHDRSGCGLVLAGSHNLYSSFMRPERRGHLEQWLSRIDHRDQLPGLRENEVREIMERELRKKLGDRLVKAFTEQCRVDDIFSGAGSGEGRTYLSVRRLVKALAQYKAKKEAAA